MVKTKKSKIDFFEPSPSFTSADVSELSGVSLRQLQWWDEKKVVSPRQIGHRRLYLPEEVLEISVIAELRRKGFSLQKIRRVLRFVQREVGKRLAEIVGGDSDLHLVTDGKSIYLEDNQSRIIDIFKNARQPLFLVCLSDQIRRISGTFPATRKPVARETHVQPRAAAQKKSKSN
jgi:DNA-binding transcriptional MerR regulator